MDPTSASIDSATRAAVLRLLLVEQPAPLSRDEVVRELSIVETEQGQDDSIARAIRELTAAGLVNSSGDLLFPSRAARAFDALDLD